MNLFLGGMNGISQIIGKEIYKLLCRSLSFNEVFLFVCNSFDLFLLSAIEIIKSEGHCYIDFLTVQVWTDC